MHVTEYWWLMTVLIKESLTKVDPKLATPQGYPFEIRHFNWVRNCQQEAPLPREQPVPPHLSVSVLKVLALITMSSLPELFSSFHLQTDLKWEREDHFRFVISLWTANSGNQERVRRLALVGEVPGDMISRIRTEVSTVVSYLMTSDWESRMKMSPPVL